MLMFDLCGKILDIINYFGQILYNSHKGISHHLLHSTIAIEWLGFQFFNSSSVVTSLCWI